MHWVGEINESQTEYEENSNYSPASYGMQENIPEDSVDQVSVVEETNSEA